MIAEVVDQVKKLLLPAILQQTVNEPMTAGMTNTAGTPFFDSDKPSFGIAVYS